MALGQDSERLARVPLLRCLEPDALRLLAFAGDSRIVPAGGSLFHAGEGSDGAYLVVSGTFVLKRDGGEARVEPGALIGEAALVRDVVHAATAEAVETSTVFRLPRTAMLRILEEHPLSARRMLAHLARRLNTALSG